MSNAIWYNNILYTNIGNNKLMIGTGIDTGTNPNGVRSKDTVPENLILPSHVYFKTVAVIGRNSFSSCTIIKSIFIPATIERIDCYSLEYLSNLVNITVAPNSKLIIKAYAFHNTNNNFVIYFGGTKCQNENIIDKRAAGYKYTVIVSSAYKCKTFGNFQQSDNFTVDYSIKGIGIKRTCPKQRTSSLCVCLYILLVRSV